MKLYTFSAFTTILVHARSNHLKTISVFGNGESSPTFGGCIMSQNAKRYPAWLRIRTTKKRKAGFSLIELVVVLAVLALLVGIAIPILGGISRKAEAASNATGLGEASKLVQLSKALGEGLGTGWDSLIDVNDDVYTGLANPVPLTPITLTAPQVQALADSGITTFGNHAVAPVDKTIGANNSTATPPIITGTVLAEIAPATVQSELGIIPDPTLTYIAMGMGMRNSLIGTRMQEAPLSSVNEKNPIDVYSRYILVFAFKTAGGGKARFVGTLDAELKGLQYNQTKYNLKSTE